MSGKFPIFSTWGSSQNPVNVTDALLKSHITTLNPCWMNYPEVSWWSDVLNKSGTWPTGSASILQYGFKKNIRAEYLFSHNSTKYIDSTSSCPNY
jgi:hypothetical protein